MNYLRKTFVLLLALISLSAVAQTMNDTSHVSKTWIGVNTADIFLNDPLILPTVAVVWNYYKNSHMRFQLGYDALNTTGDIDISSSQPFNNAKIDTVSKGLPSTDWTTSFQLGYFYSKYVNPKVDLYFGADFVFRLNKSNYKTNFEITQDFGNSNKQFIDLREKRLTSVQGYGVSPMAGVRWKISQGVQIAFETQALFLVQQSNLEVFTFSSQTSSFNPNEFVQETHRKEGSRESITRLLPMGGLFLYLQL